MTMQIADVRLKPNTMKISRACPNVWLASRQRELFGLVTESETSLSDRLTTIGLLVWWIAYLYPLVAVFDLEDISAAQGTTEGSVVNRLLVLSFAGLGGVYLPRAIRALRVRPEVATIFYLLAGYLFWSAATILWSIDGELSVRRLAILVLLLIGTVGLGGGFYAQTRDGAITLARHVLYASWIAIGVLIASRLWHQNLSELLNPDWTLKYDTSEQYYMFAAAYGLISAIVLYPSAKIKRGVSVGVLGLVLLLLKGRTMIAGTLAVCLLISACLSKRGWWRATAFAGGLILSLEQVDLALGGRIVLSCTGFVADKLASLLPYLTIGHGMDDLLTLSGRIPLWHTLWPQFRDHPFVGHGFGAFWYPDRFADVYHEVLWPAVAAHNGFLDELLGTGVIGLLMFLAFWLASMHCTLRVAKEDKRSGYLVFGWLLLFLFCNSTGSILQGYFQAPFFFSATALFAVLAWPFKRQFTSGFGRIIRT